MKTIDENQDYPVDMVYLWCDGNDPEFMQRKIFYADRGKYERSDRTESFSQVRFFDNEELKYSLRSMEMYAPWIRHVFIVTDRQIPKWLNMNCAKVTIVDHSEILPQEIIPCFNSSVIERYIGFIPNLAEHFLYANDDLFFGKKLSKDFFFAKEKPIMRLKNCRKNIYRGPGFKGVPLDDFFGQSTVNAWDLLWGKNRLQGEYPFWELHHNIDAFTKTGWCNTFFKYKSDLDKRRSRFRTMDDISRLLFSLEAVVNKCGELRIVKDCSRLEKLFCWLKRLEPESYYLNARVKSVLILFFLHPILFCINGSGANRWGNRLEKIFLEWRFPQKSSFEK